MNLSKVESIIYDNILREKRKMKYEDYELFCDDEMFYNDLEKNDKICSIAELKDAIEKMNDLLEEYCEE